MNAFKLFLLCLLSAAGSAQAGNTNYAALSREMKAVWGKDTGFAAKREQTAALYPKLETAFPGNLKSADTESLGALMEALNGAWYFLEDESIVNKAEKVFGELAGRRFATADHILEMQTMYLGAHRFGDAARIREEYSEVDTWAVPPSVTGGAAVTGPYRYYSLEAGGGELRLDRAPLSEKPVIVFYGSPGCKFSVQALKELPAIPAVKAALLARGLFITTDDDFKELGSWNENNPWKYLKVHSRKDWPGVKMAGAPEFTIFSEGVPVCYGRGWHGKETSAEFLNCLEKAGIMADTERMRTAVSAVTAPAAQGLPLEELRGIISGEYASLAAKGAFGAAALGTYSGEELAAAFDFLNFFSSGSPDPAAAEAMRKIYALLEEKGLGGPEKGKDLFGVLLAVRDFETAGQFRSSHQKFGLPQVPEIKGSAEAKPGRRLVYEMGNSPQMMNAESVDPEKLGVVLVGIPGCHFCNYALAAIESDPKLLKVFRKRGLLLTSRADFPRILKRNAAKELKYRLVADTKDWPGLDFASSPTFYFMKEGKVLYSFSGWPKTGKMDELYIGLGRLGLMGD